jgi:hypothetical protein
VRNIVAALAAVSICAVASAHVTPNIQLVKRGDFIRESLPGAVKLFEKTLMIGGPDMAAIKKATDWSPSEEEAKIYVGRDAEGKTVGTAAFVWMPSAHGPVGVAVAFDEAGKILRADVTDVGTEPLVWVRPLLGAGMEAFRGLSLSQPPDAAAVAPAVKGKMNRYYADVIAGGIARAQSLERVALSLEKG